MTITIDLSRLPPPSIIEPLSYETILAEMRAELKNRCPDWTASEIESDPANKVLEVCAYRELNVRQRVNDAARANLLAFAASTDLDHLAAFYGVTRLEAETPVQFEARMAAAGRPRNSGETDAAYLARMASAHGVGPLPAEADAALRLRIQNRIQGWANAGGAAHYRYWALSAGAGVKDAAVSSPSQGIVRIAVLATGGGAPSDELLDAVRAVVTRDDVRVLTDTVEVVPATIKTVDVTARVWLYPETPIEVFDAARTAFAPAVDEARGLGWDLTRSWIVGPLQAARVHRVELDAPLADATCGPTECVALGSVAITLEGRNR